MGIQVSFCLSENCCKYKINTHGAELLERWPGIRKGVRLQPIIVKDARNVNIVSCKICCNKL